MEQKRRCRIICIFFYSGVHLEKVYESKKELSTGFSTVVNSNNIISQNAEKVNYVNTDNKGRQLTQEQQEYFKDSKARNDNGELEVYTTVKPE